MARSCASCPALFPFLVRSIFSELLLSWSVRVSLCTGQGLLEDYIYALCVFLGIQSYWDTRERVWRCFVLNEG